jgi:hypothetical protein
VIFISYSHRDQKFVDQLSRRLVHAGVKLWRDKWKTSAGDSFIEAIEQAVDGAAYFVLVVSKHSLASRWVNKELADALARRSSRRDLTVVPLFIDGSKLPAKIEGLLGVDFRRRFRAGLGELLSLLARRYNLEAAGSASFDPHYFFDYAFEERSEDGKYFLQVDMVSVDREESFRILTQLTFTGNEHATAAAYGVTPERSWRRILLETCAEAFKTKGLFQVNVLQPSRTQFFLGAKDERARITANLRIALLGRPSHRVIVWPVGGLLAQLLAASAPPSIPDRSRRRSNRAKRAA